MTQENLLTALTNLDFTDVAEIETTYLETRYDPLPSDKEAETFMKRAETLYHDRFNDEDNERLGNLIIEYGISNGTAGFYRGFQAALLMIKANTIHIGKAFKK